MRVYITGSKGMLGMALREQHAYDGHEVFGCDISTAYREGDHDCIDIRDRESLRLRLAAVKPDRVYHCAAMLGVQNTENHPDVCADINENGTECVVDVCRELGVPHLVFLSSSEVYGNGDGTTPFNEDDTLRGRNVYAIGKAASEHYVLAKSSGETKTTVCRMFNCYGPYQVRQFFVPKIIELAKRNETIRLYGNAENKRSYLYSADAAIHIRNVADNAPSGEIVNVAHAVAYTLGDVARLVVERTRSKSDIIRITENYPDRKVSRDIPNRLADVTKLQIYSKTQRPFIGPRTGILCMVQLWNTTAGDWTYERKCGLSW